MERSTSNDAFSPSRNLGFMVWGNEFDQHMAWATGFFRTVELSEPIRVAVSALACVVDRFCSSIDDNAPISVAVNALTCFEVSSVIWVAVKAWIWASIRPRMVVEEIAWTCVAARYCRSVDVNALT